MSDNSIQYDWLILFLVYNHKHYDEMYAKVPGYRTMESQKNHLFQVIENVEFNEKIKIVLIENRLSFARNGDEIIGVNEVINVVEKTNAKRLQTVDKDDDTEIESFTDPTTAAAIIQTVNEKYRAGRHIIITL